MSVRNYDPKAVSLVIGSLVIGGYADDDFIDVERDDDAYSKKTGVDGETTRAKNNVTSGKITIKLMQSSTSNDDLTALAAADELDTMDGIRAVTCRDLSGRSVFSGDGWIKKFPKQTFKKDVNTVEWVIDMANLKMNIGSNNT